jgi:AraC family transcriptional regulator
MCSGAQVLTGHRHREPSLSIREVGGFELAEAQYEPGFRGDVLRHPIPYFVYVVKGDFRESCSCGSVPYGRGSLHFHPSDDPHSGTVGEHGARCFTITPKEDSLAGLLDSGIRRLRHESWPRVIASLASRCHGGFHARDSASDLECEGTALELIAAALRLQTPHESAASGWLSVVREYLHARVAEPVTLTDLAAVSGVPRVHLAREFRRVLGVTPAEYVRRLRLDVACRTLVETDQSIAEVALDCGFSSQAHLTRAFGARLGVTPAAYRRARGARA